MLTQFMQECFGVPAIIFGDSNHTFVIIVIVDSDNLSVSGADPAIRIIKVNPTAKLDLVFLHICNTISFGLIVNNWYWLWFHPMRLVRGQ